MRQRTEHARRQRAWAALERERSWSPLGSPDGDDPGLREAWDQLSATDREVLALVGWEQLSVADAACSLGCSALVFSVRLYRARRRLESLLAAAGALSTVELSEA
jgi:RNA polymerase sigma-70 factor (ECF subfamily)